MKTNTLLLLIIIVLLVVIGGVLLSRLPPVTPKPASPADGRADCLINQKIIESAKDQWSVENNKRDGEPTDLLTISTYTKGFPVCPSGGRYRLGNIGELATCSLPEHQPEK